MLKRSATWLLGSWFLVMALAVTASLALEARFTTIALLFFVGAAPAAVTLMIGLSAPAPTVAEILHAVHTEKSRG